MSLDQAKQFIERVKTDEAFREKILAAEDVAERLRLANAAGYEVTEEDLTSASAQLSDAELAGVAGGMPGYNSCDDWLSSLTEGSCGETCDHWG